MIRFVLWCLISTVASTSLVAATVFIPARLRLLLWFAIGIGAASGATSGLVARWLRVAVSRPALLVVFLLAIAANVGSTTWWHQSQVRDLGPAPEPPQSPLDAYEQRLLKSPANTPDAAASGSPAAGNAEVNKPESGSSSVGQPSSSDHPEAATASSPSKSNSSNSMSPIDDPAGAEAIRKALLDDRRRRDAMFSARRQSWEEVQTFSGYLRHRLKPIVDTSVSVAVTEWIIELIAAAIVAVLVFRRLNRT